MSKKKPMKRAPIEMCLSLLQQCIKGEKSPSRITAFSKMNCTMGRTYLDFLCQKGYLSVCPAKPKLPPGRRTALFTRKYYFITDEGRMLLKFALPLLKLSFELKDERPRYVLPKLLAVETKEMQT